MMMTTLCLAGAILAIGLSGFYSGSETGMYCLNRLRLRLDAEEGAVRALRLARLLDHDQASLSTLLVGSNVANYMATVLVAYVLSASVGADAGASEIYTTLIVTPVVFVFGEVVPKMLFQRNADHLMRLGSGFFSLSAALFRPPVFLLNQISRPILALCGTPGSGRTLDPRRRIALLLRDAIAADDAAGEHIEFVDRVLALPSVALHEVMVPRNRVVAIRAGADRKECMSLIRKHPHSRLLVFDKSPRRVMGYVQVHKLLADDGWNEVQEHVRRAVSIPAHESVASAIVKLQTARESFAIVVDRSGYLLGLVTLKDLLEELTGEMHAW